MQRALTFLRNGEGEESSGSVLLNLCNFGIVKVIDSAEWMQQKQALASFPSLQAHKDSSNTERELAQKRFQQLQTRHQQLSVFHTNQKEEYDALQNECEVTSARARNPLWQAACLIGRIAGATPTLSHLRHAALKAGDAKRAVIADSVQSLKLAEKELADAKDTCDRYQSQQKEVLFA